MRTRNLCATRLAAVPACKASTPVEARLQPQIPPGSLFDTITCFRGKVWSARPLVLLSMPPNSIIPNT